MVVYTLAKKEIYEGRAYWFLKSPKSGFRFVKKNPKSRLSPSILTFFQIFSFDLSFSPEDTYSLVLIYRLKSPQDMG
jgi:hypothetical protein